MNKIKIRKIISTLFKAGIGVSLAEGKLKTIANPEALSPALIQVIKKNKQEIIMYLGKYENNNILDKELTIYSTKRVNDQHILSFSQQRFWLIDRMGGGSPQYNMPVAFHIKGRFNLDTAEQTFTKIIHRHESLRTIFLETDNGPMQIVRDKIDFKIQRYDISVLKKDKNHEKMNALMDEDSQKVFDLSSDLMLRVSYIHLAGKDNVVEGILLLCMHHIASDGWSIDILIDEFIQCYQFALIDGSDPLPPLAIQYVDYSYWQKKCNEEGIFESQQIYWVKQLRGIAAVHSLRLDYPRPAIKAYQGGIVSSNLGFELSQRLQQFVKDNNVTLFVMLHAALALVLSRHSNNNDVIIGSPIAGRMNVDIEPLIGCFVNTLVLRVDTDHKTYSDYINHVKKVNQGALENQDIPFDQVVELCKVPRSTQYTPLFQIMFSMDTHNIQASNRYLDDALITTIDCNCIIAKFDLEIIAKVIDDDVYFSWIYDRSILKHQHIVRLNDHFSRLLSEMINSHHADINDLTMLSSKEIHYLLYKLNNTDRVYSEKETIHGLFEKQVERTPDKIAIAFEDKFLTYKEVNDSANRLTHYLIDQGVNAEMLIGIYIERSLEMIVGILAILKAGGFYLPIDLMYPEARLQYIFANSGLKYLLSQSDLICKHVIQENIKVLLLDSESCRKRLLTYNSDNPVHTVKQFPSNLAYVIYTSGSTGQPKGVLVEHKSVTSHLLAVSDILKFNATDNILLVVSVGFDVFIEQAFAGLFAGATLYIAGDKLLDQRQFFRIIIKYAISVSDVPLAYLSQWLTESLHKKWSSSVLSRLVVGGEALNTSIVRKWHMYGKSTHCKLFNAYGPTEGVITTTLRLIDKEDEETVRIGSVLGNRKLYVLDKNGSLCPYGVTGELYIGGNGLARGYLNDPGLTIERFILNPFNNNKNERLYKTGDLVRYIIDNNLEFIGRVDEQIKVRGFRIEPGEIEQVLLANETVVSCVVIAQNDKYDQKRLVSYIVLKDKEDFSFYNTNLLAQLRESLQASLPDYMLPSSITVIDSIPLTAHGKLDREGLPEPEFQSGEIYIAPRNELEKSLCHIWEQLLGVNKIGIHDNFFRVGGNSFNLILLHNKISSELNLNVQIVDLFNHFTISKFLEYLTQSNLIQASKTDKKEVNVIAF